MKYDFSEEKKKDYISMKNSQEKVLNIARFISNIWQIHLFCDGNTRTIAVFSAKYLKSKGIEANNNIFKDNSVYFCNALVLANYENVSLHISFDFYYLESFL